MSPSPEGFRGSQATTAASGLTLSDLYGLDIMRCVPGTGLGSAMMGGKSFGVTSVFPQSGKAGSRTKGTCWAATVVATAASEPSERRALKYCMVLKGWVRKELSGSEDKRRMRMRAKEEEELVVVRREEKEEKWVPLYGIPGCSICTNASLSPFLPGRVVDVPRRCCGTACEDCNTASFSACLLCLIVEAVAAGQGATDGSVHQGHLLAHGPRPSHELANRTTGRLISHDLMTPSRSLEVAGLHVRAADLTGRQTFTKACSSARVHASDA